jgi:hypothetical protein
VTSQIVELYVPCDVVAVQVWLAPDAALSPIEQLVLRSIDAGRNSVDDLKKVLSLSHRLVIDLLSDLWSRHHVVLNLTEGVAKVSPQVREAIRRKCLHELEAGEVREETREIMVDRLTGFPLVRRGERIPSNRRLAVPTDHLDRRIEDVPSSLLLRALVRTVEEEEVEKDRNRRRSAPLQVLRARLRPRHLVPRHELRWLRLPTNVALDDHDELHVELRNDGPLPLQQRERASRELARLIEDDPDSEFVRTLRGSAQHGWVEPPALPELLDRLARKVGEAAGANAGVREAHHHDLVELADHLRDGLEARLDAGAQLTRLRGRKEQIEALHRLVTEAQRQLVICSPWIAYEALSPFLPDLRDALDRGVRIFLLWGIGPDDSLPTAVRHAFQELERRGRSGAVPGQLFVSFDRSSRVHAKVAVKDQGEALVTSLNLLSSVQGTAREIGLLVVGASADSRTRSEALETLLRWCQRQYPDWVQAQAMRTTAEPLGSSLTRAATLPLAPVGFELPPVPGPPQSTRGSQDDDVSMAEVRAWSAAWQSWTDLATERLLPAAHQAVDVLVDGDHRRVLDDAIAKAGRRLLITSDQLGPDVVDRSFVKRLQGCAARGCSVVLVHHKLTAAAHSDIDLYHRLQALTAASDGKVRIMVRPVHAKVLVADDRVVVGSFNYLSFDGYYGQGRQRRVRSELSVATNSPALADDLWSTLTYDTATSPSDAGTGTPAVAVPDASDAGTTDPLESPMPAARSLLTQVSHIPPDDSDAIAVAIEDAFADVTPPWAVLTSLGEVEAPTWLQERAAAAALRSALAPGLAGDAAPVSEQARDTARCLVQRLWARHRFVEAAILLTDDDLTGPDVRPRRELAGLAAASVYGTADYTAVPYDGLLGPERLPVVALAWHGVLLRESPDAAMLLELMLDEIAEDGGLSTWSELALAAVDWWEKWRRALPVDDLRRVLANRSEQGDLVHDWQALTTAMTQVSAATFSFVPATKTHARLLHDEGVLGRLRTIADRRDLVALRRWTEAQPTLDAATIVDTATSELGIRDPIDGRPRTSFLRRVERTLAAAQRLVGSHVALESAGHDRTVLAAVELADQMRSRWPNLLAEARGAECSGEVEDHVVQWVLDEVGSHIGVGAL